MANAKFEAAMAVMHRERQASGVNLGGKLYSMVKDRIELFRKEWGDEYGIDTEVDYTQGFSQGSIIVARAKVTKDGTILASGHAMEIVGSNDYTINSPVEVAETSAIGRALACFGLHGGEYASAQEVQAKRRDNDSPASRGPQPNGPTPQARRDPPPATPSGLYVPDGDGAFLQPDVEQDKVLMQIGGIPDVKMLGRYWNELKPFMGYLNAENPDMAAEIKAAFAVANNALGGK
jgi:hypothetical protein